MKKFKDIHKGNRGWLVACGPSLNNIDLSLLESEITFGVSLSYKTGLDLNYNFMGDYKIASQFYKDILELDNTWFVSERIYKEFLRNRPNTYYFSGYKKGFNKDLSDGRLYGGGTSTYVAMQFAHWMGIETLICVGLDHYATYDTDTMDIKKLGIKNNSGEFLVRSGGKDPHHFLDDYYGHGVEFYLPTVHKMEESYEMARKTFEDSGRKLYNASVHTALPNSVIPRVIFEDIL